MHIKNTFKALFTHRTAPFQIRKIRKQEATVGLVITSELPTHLQIKATHSGRIDLLMTRRDMITVKEVRRINISRRERSVRAKRLPCSPRP